MKLPVLRVVFACLACISTLEGYGQQPPGAAPDRPYLGHTEPSRLYFTMPPTDSTGIIELAATDAQINPSPRSNLTSADVEPVLQLKGNVQVRICSTSRYGCERGSILLRADAVDYNEKTGDMDAHGDVHIHPDRAQYHHARYQRPSVQP